MKIWDSVYIYFFKFQRPTAKELSRHPFIKKAKRNNHLIDLIDRFRKWKLTHNAESDTESDSDADQVKKLDYFMHGSFCLLLLQIYKQCSFLCV